MAKPQQFLEEVPAKEVDAILVVCQAHAGPEVHQVDPDVPVNQEPQDCPVTLESHQFNLASQSLHHHANHAHRDHRDLQDPLDPQEMQDNPEPQATQEATAHPENQVQRDHQDHPDNLDSQAPPESQELPLKAHHPNQAPQDLPEMLDHQDHQDHQDSRAATLAQVPPDPKDHQDQQDHQETMDSQEHPDNPEHQEMQERRVSARNTAPSMVESSSRTELAAVKMELPVVGLFGVPTTCFTLLLFVQFKHQKISFNGNVFNLA